MADVTLRQYRPGDWEAMYALDLECFEAAFRFSRRAMRAFAEAPGAISVLAEAERALAGFCIAEVAQQVGYVLTLDVAAACRRTGLARRLMAEAEAKVEAAGGRSMALHVFTGNAGAVRFYEAIGYQQLGIEKEFYGRKRDALMYAKKFNDQPISLVPIKGNRTEGPGRTLRVRRWSPKREL